MLFQAHRITTNSISRVFFLTFPRLTVVTLFSTRTPPGLVKYTEKPIDRSKGLTTSHTFKMATSSDIEDLHTHAVQLGQLTYIDPDTGYTVFTQVAHLKRGNCCGNKCRHCPYGWANVRGINNQNLPPSFTCILNDEPIIQSGNDMQIQNRLKQLVTSPAASLTTHKNVPYTRKGDGGMSSLRAGQPLPKNSLVFDALGVMDELSSHIGLVHATLMANMSTNNPDYYGPLPHWLLDIMSQLFDITSYVATVPQQSDTVLLDLDIPTMETWINQMTDPLPDLHSFILPTGAITSAQLHVARCVCRRAERVLISWKESQDIVVDQNIPLDSTSKEGPLLHGYLNRLSDFLFTAARFVNYCEKKEEIQYKRVDKSLSTRSRVIVSLQQEMEGDKK